jgi:cbb3-type cytochrome oxidase subunit 3
MDGHTFGLVELLGVFGGVIAWALWEIWSTRRSLRDDEKKASRESEDARTPD